MTFFNTWYVRQGQPALQRTLSPAAGVVSEVSWGRLLHFVDGVTVMMARFHRRCAHSLRFCCPRCAWRFPLRPVLSRSVFPQRIQLSGLCCCCRSHFFSEKGTFLIGLVVQALLLGSGQQVVLSSSLKLCQIFCPRRLA
jgi:hypothetical protein